MSILGITKKIKFLTTTPTGLGGDLEDAGQLLRGRHLPASPSDIQHYLLLMMTEL